MVGEAVAFARVGGVSSEDPSSGKYSLVGEEGGAVGPAVDGKTVALACDGGVNNDDRGKYFLVEKKPIVVVLIGASVTTL